MDALLSANLIWTILALAALAINVLALIHIPRERKTTAAMAWLLLIFLLPFAGMALYLLIGNFRLPKKRRDEQARITALIDERAGDQRDGRCPRWLQRVAQQNHTLTGLPVVGGSSALLIYDYQGSIDAMAAAVQRGVTVRLLADYIASRKVPKSKETFAELERIGVVWSWMLPVGPFKRQYQRPDLRNHRKLVVVDGVVGFVGSQNLIARDYNSEKNIARGLMWHELVARVDGAVVAQVDAVFLSDWLIEAGEDLSEVILTSPYFVPDEAMIYAITTACQRGLDVQLFVSELGDQGMGLSHAEVVLRDAAASQRAHLPVPSAIHPARETLLRR